MTKLAFPLQGKTSMTAEMLKQAFYEQIQGDTRFDRVFHSQYLSMERTPAWYKGPDDSREMSRALASSAVDRVWALNPREEHLLQVAGKSSWRIASGCLELEIFVMGDNALGMEVNFTTHYTKTYSVTLNP